MKYLRMQQITKYYSANQVQALEDASLEADRGTIHGIVGENGAGKTTLMKILCGMEQEDSGTIVLKESPVRIPNPKVAYRYGIGMVHQHFRLIDRFTVAQNVGLGVEPKGRVPFWISSKRMEETVFQLCQQTGLRLDPTAIVGRLTMGQKQKAEILRLLYRNVDLLILDEPTSVLNDREVDELFQTLHRLREQGKTLLFITHKLHELMQIADTVTVLRKGKTVFHSPTNRTDPKELAVQMVGAVIPVEREDNRVVEDHPPLVSVRNLSVLNPWNKEILSSLSFDLCRGEILGIGGVTGNGQQTLAQALFGLIPIDRGEILFDNRAIQHQSPAERRRSGMGYIPEDRLYQGSSLYATISENLIVDRFRLPLLCKKGCLSPRSVRIHTDPLIQQFRIEPADGRTRVGLLSGGNIQKTVIAREISARPRFLIVSEPTWGLDLRAADLVHRQLQTLRDQKSSMILFSSNLQELILLSDRILIMYKGTFTALVTPQELRGGDRDFSKLRHYLSGLHALDDPQTEEIHETLR